ncbi:hypothetical protein FNV43_RR21206 [Rhamnella rubrinervis]|uniref:Uncharacterized protein n=1 Tax=Rhamnella rubrinervis TaxID=2594499 RepID=A0A8K0GU59_9ROSA|nr:hypothetical protein FNV43_RR21206 [Rhamnella rubrinervis]
MEDGRGKLLEVVEEMLEEDSGGSEEVVEVRGSCSEGSHGGAIEDGRQAAGCQATVESPEGYRNMEDGRRKLLEGRWKMLEAEDAAPEKLASPNLSHLPPLVPPPPAWSLLFALGPTSLALVRLSSPGPTSHRLVPPLPGFATTSPADPGTPPASGPLAALVPTPPVCPESLLLGPALPPAWSDLLRLWSDLPGWSDLPATGPTPD